MKKILLLIICCWSLIQAQTINIGTGASMNIGAGADICAGGAGNITGTLSGSGTQCSGALPVELISFNANCVASGIKLVWWTATEYNCSSYNIQRKALNGSWEIISEIKSTGNSNSPKQYTFTDQNVNAGKQLYRLKMIDNDGSFEYSSEAEAEISAPAEFSLEQNYPNPFNPSTTINFAVAKAGHVKLSVYNSIGSEAAILVDEYKTEGIYKVQFNGSNLASGIYLYRLEADNYSAVKKFIFMK